MCKNYFEMFYENMISDGKSIKSVENYKYDQKKFENFIETKGLTMRDINKFDFSLINDFKIVLTQKDLAANTINRTLRFLNSFFNYMVDMGIINENPCERVKSIKVAKREKVIPKKEDVETVIQNLDEKINDSNNRTKCHNFISTRNKLIITMLSRTGLRNTEIRELKLSNINIKTGELSVIGKGNRERILFLGNGILEEYKEYLKVRRSHLEKFNKESDLVFMSYRCKMIGKSNLGDIVKQAAQDTNVLNNPHQLRHFMATETLRKTKNIATVKTILGHSNISTTQIYIHSNKDDIREAMADED